MKWTEEDLESKPAVEKEVVAPIVEETPAEVEKKRGRPAKAKEEAKVEQVEEKVEGTTLEELLNKPKSKEDSVDSVWSDVEKLTGESIEVDFEGEDE